MASIGGHYMAMLQEWESEVSFIDFSSSSAFSPRLMHLVVDFAFKVGQGPTALTLTLTLPDCLPTCLPARLPA